MKKTLIFLFVCLPMMALAQATLTPEQQLEQAQRQLEAAKAALETAKAAKAKAEAEAEAKENAAKAEAEAKEIRRKIAETKAETERLRREAAAVSEAAGKMQAVPAAKDGAKEDGNAVEKENPAAWTVPTAPAARRTKNTADLKEKDSKDFYLQPGTVPEAGGQVIWTECVSVPGTSADELYRKAFAYLTELTQSDNQLEGSKVALVNEKEHSIVATVREKLIFSSSFLSLDYTQFNYVLQVACREGQAMLTMNRLTYKYDVQGNVSNFAAETWITDKYAVNKKRTRLLPVSGKFRRATVDRKNSIFEGFRQTLK
ncbi:DUF4468 domain-containing protein [Prevotella multiformis]|uniref:DUF4468 domain-containing protein n=1 Tax=Prevotella multiformis DSM 16608 TaxID=888743 RepID=F0FAD5_9BACT|nr:DUF4468 domain-containing protein [Prevotella multiformis]EGC18859.1 hypothetical protein HMPREF9141_2552 [Prevotella multiformis DSM 16608]